MPRSKEPLPEPLSRAALQFEEWRRTRPSGRDRIPGRLWAEAARLAAEYGVSRTALALRVRYYDLKRRLTGAVPVEPTFVEILPAVGGRPECIVEFEDLRGTKMRIRLAWGSTDVTALARLFLERRS